MNHIRDAIDYLENFAPLKLAESWDNVGLILGDPDSELKRIMTCLTVTPESANEAVDREANLIVTHHPMLFRPIQKLTTCDAQGEILWNLARHGIAVYSPHTAFDSAWGGINDMIANRLSLQNTEPLRPMAGKETFKIIVFLPASDLEPVSNALFSSGAGVIGNYTKCSFRSPGIGSFEPNENAHSTIGAAGQLESLEELKLEILVSRQNLRASLDAIRASHSYEEPAFDVVPLEPQDSRHGSGRVGTVGDPTSLGQLAYQYRDATNSQHVALVGDKDRAISKVAIGCGSGGEFLQDAARSGCDVLLTGEATFHKQLEAHALGIAMLMVGHYASERFAVEELANIMQVEFSDVDIWASEHEREPSEIDP